MTPTQTTTVGGSSGLFTLALIDLGPIITAAAGFLAIVCSCIFIYDRFFGKKGK